MKDSNRTSPDLIIPRDHTQNHPLADATEYHPPAIFLPPKHITSATVVDSSRGSISIAYPGGYERFPIKPGQVTDYGIGDVIEFIGLNDDDDSEYRIFEAIMTYTPFERNALQTLYQQHLPPPKEDEHLYYEKMNQYIEFMQSLLDNLELNDLAVIAYIKYYLDQHTFSADDKADIFQDIRDTFHVALNKKLHSQFPAHQFGSTAVQQKKKSIQSILSNSISELTCDDSYFTLLSFLSASMALLNLEDYCTLPKISFFYLLQNRGIDTRRLDWLSQACPSQLAHNSKPKSKPPHQTIKTKDLKLIFECFFQAYYIHLTPKQGDFFSDLNSIQNNFVAFMRGTLSQLNCDNISIQSHLIALLSNVTVLSPFEEMETARHEMDCIIKNILLTYDNIMRPKEDGISFTDRRRENKMFSNNINFIRLALPGILPNILFFIFANYITLYTNDYNQDSFLLFFSFLNTLLHQHLPHSYEFTSNDNAIFKLLFDHLSRDLISTNSQLTFQQLFLKLQLRFSKEKKFIQPDPTLRVNTAFFKPCPLNDSDAFINSIMKDDIDIGLPPLFKSSTQYM